MPGLACLIALAGVCQGQSPPAELDQGITFRIYSVEEDLKAIPNLIADQTPNVDELRATIDFRDAAAFGNVPPPLVSYAIGWLAIDQSGAYTFRLTSDDGSKLLIDGQLAIDNDGTHGAKAVDSAAIHLDPGLHALRIEHFDHTGQKRLTLEWKPPSATAFSLVPTSALRAERDLTRVTSPGVKRIDDGRRPGDGKPVAGVHPGWSVTTIRPEGFEPMIGAMTFAADGRLIVGTFNPLQRDDRTLPDIESKKPDKLFALSNVKSGDPTKVAVSICADGLYEPAGLCAVGDDLYVSHRREITRLRDLDRDGFYETHETVASGWEAWNYHQFTFGLVHRDGKLYATLSTAMAPPGWEGMGTNAAPNGPMRGCVLEVDLASHESHVIAGGLRAPNGIGLGPPPHNSLFYLDNQGAWMPASQFSEVIPGRFYGHHNRTNFVPNLADRFPDGGAASAYSDRPRTPATILLPHNEICNSPTQPMPITEGPFAGQMYVGELTGGGIRRLFLERVNGQWQGTVFQFTQGFESGVNRLIWGPDGALYAGGIGAGGDWNWRGTKFGLQRLAPTGKTAFEYHSMRALPDGFAVHFTKPVDRAWLENPANYTIKQWTYKPTKEYGGNKIDEQPLTVSRAVASKDGASVTLTIDGLKEGYCIYLRCDPTSLNGEKIWATEAWYTLNQIPRTIPGAPPSTSPTIAGERIDPEAHGVGLSVLPPASAATLLASSADVVFRKGDQDQLPREGSRSPDELAALPGFVEIVPGSGDLITGTTFGDARMHIEWLAPPGGEGQMAGNSGVYLQDLYEIQVLGTLASEGQPKIDEAGSIYNFKAADVNASTGPGHWQAYDIWFRAPRFENGRKTEDARVTMFWNGVLVHDDVTVPAPTGSRKAGGERGAVPGTNTQVGPLRLQDHPTQAQGGVRYRNIWIAPLHDVQYKEGEWQDLIGEASADGLPKDWVVRGGEAAFRVENNEVIGSSRPNTPNTFLVTQREYSDFELLLEYRLEGLTNSGVQIRSHVIDGFDNRAGGLRGMQVEIDGTERGYTAGLYDEQRRGWLHRMIDAPYARSAVRKDKWNRVRIVAQGPIVRTWLNGVPAAEVFDAMDTRGHIGLQVHGVGDTPEPLSIRFRNIRIRELTPND